MIVQTSQRETITFTLVPAAGNNRTNLINRYNISAITTVLLQ